MTTYQTAAALMRAKDALTALFALVIFDKQNLRDAVMELSRLSLADMLSELADWRRAPDLTAASCNVLTQHGF